MRPRSNSPTRWCASVLGAGVAISGLALSPVQANPAGTGLVINEVYGGGGNSGAPFTHDFVELYNPTSAPISVAGATVEYFSASGGSGGKATLTGSVPAGAHWLVRAGGGSVGAALPEPDDSFSAAMSATNGRVDLSDSSGTLLDRVGFGSANSYEGTSAAPAGSNTTSLSRGANGKDTDDNGVDLTSGAPTPTASGADPVDPVDPVDPQDATIAQIQGAGAATPLEGTVVTTRGVVTAAFPAGGLDGFYIQTPGPDTTPDASDGVFVYRPGFAENVVPGASVEVVGTATEFSGLTQVNATAGTVTVLSTSLGDVVPKTVVPGTDCALPGDACLKGAALDAAREKSEGELFAPTGDFTVTDVYDGSAYNGGSASSSNFGEVGLAARSDLPLLTVTDVVDPHDKPAVAARTAYNDAHRLILDDGSSWNYGAAANTSRPIPWHTPTHQVRVGAAVSFPQPVVLDQRFGWKLQPTTQVVGAPSASQPQFEQTRKAPEAVKGELTLGTFNVLNYFTTLGSSLGAACTSYKDRAGTPVTVNSCPGNGPRGAWGTADFERQQTKIVKAINTLDADVVSLEEIENSLVVDGGDRDEAIGALVAALNADAGATRWAFVPSPATLPTGEDVIRTGLIYDPATVETVQGAQILVGASAFDNAREPLAQAFKPKGGDAVDTFAVIVNHFKSKGSGTPDPDGQGNANIDRIAQAQALLTFADAFGDARGTDKLFLTGDFNSYSQEDPIVELEEGGYEVLKSSFEGAEKSYSFDGASGSLDHVLASPAAKAWVEEVDVWESNANETVYTQYSRHNYNVTELVDATGFSASDHNPEIVGFTPGRVAPVEPVELQLLSSNDFHGRLAAAAPLAGAVGQLRAEKANTLYVSGGDMLGASTFESFIAQDKPAIDVLNAMGLDVAASGNHEYDGGYADLVNRIMKPYDAGSNPRGGAEWQYLAANVRKKSDDSYALTDTAASPGTSDGATWMTEVDGLKVGFVGGVTEDLPTLVNPAGISELKVTEVVDEVNAAADRLTADGADVVVLLAHEGAQTADLASATDTSTAFGRIVAGVDDDVDVIFSGHTHLRYAHLIGGRPVMSGGEYGTHLSRVVLEVDPSTDAVSVKTNDVVEAASVTPTAASALALRTEVQGIVTAANAEAETLGARVLGKIDAPLRRAVLDTGAENRGGESNLGNLVAEVHRWATRGEAQGAAEIAFMNPGGLRSDMVGNATGGYPADVTYRQAASVQPFANTLVNMDLTGAEIKVVLEQQWQRDADGNVPTRPFLRLGASAGFTYTYDETRPEGDRITGMWLNGTSVDPTRAYSVTTNSFLANGGDQFRGFAAGTNRNDTGQSDLQAMVDFMAAASPVDVDQSQRAVGLAVTGGTDAAPGDTVTIDVSSWSFSAPGSVRDAEVQVLLDGTQVTTAPLDHAVVAAPDDRTGKATVSLVLPAGTSAGEHTVTLRGATTGTETQTRITVKADVPEKVTPTLTVTVSPASVRVKTGKATVGIRVAGGPGTPSGTVQVLDGSTVLGTATLKGGRADVRVSGLTRTGTRTLTVRYLGDDSRNPASATVKVKVSQAKPTVTVKVKKRVVSGKKATVTVRVKASGLKPTGTVKVSVTIKGRTTTKVVTLRNGVAKAKLTFRGAGTAKVKATYRGNTQVKSGSRTVKVTVVRR